MLQLSRNPDIDEEMYFGFEDNLIKRYEAWIETTEFVDAHLFTIQGFSESVIDDINHDFNLIAAAIILVGIYTFLFLGSFSAIHCRCIVAFAGLVCVAFAYLGGFGIMYILGGQSTGVHQLMPFLLIGIGVDDMFVICNAVDQIEYTKSARERITEAFKHAGPAITITSLTNSLAFAFGAANSLIALSSFCGFASVSIIMLYLSAITTFLCVLIWDTKCVSKHCFGLFRNKVFFNICCCGIFASPRQREHLGWPNKSCFAEDDKASPEIKEVHGKGITEQCLGRCFAPIVLSTVGRIVFLVIYAVLIAGAIYGAT